MTTSVNSCLKTIWHFFSKVSSQRSSCKDNWKELFRVSQLCRFEKTMGFGVPTKFAIFLVFQPKLTFLILFRCNSVAANQITLSLKSGAKLFDIFVFIPNYVILKQWDKNDLGWGKKGDVGVVALLLRTVTAFQNLSRKIFQLLFPHHCHICLYYSL